MSQRPSFQFYPADWRLNEKLRRCSLQARAAWMEVMCILHDSDEYGVARYSMAKLARATAVPVKLLKELADEGVLKGSDGPHEAFTFAPFHAGKRGPEVTLIEAGQGPCWYVSRFVKDEYIRQKRGSTTRFTEENQPPKGGGKDKPTPPPTRRVGERQGDGASSSSSSSSSTSLKYEGLKHTPPAADAGGCPVVLTGTFEGHDFIPAQTPNPVARFAIALIEAGFQATAMNPKLIAYVESGGTVEHLQAIAAMPECKGTSANYVLSFALRELTAPKASIPASVATRNQAAAAEWLAQETP